MSELDNYGIHIRFKGGSDGATPNPRTEAGAELIFYLHGALVAYPNDRAEAILAGVREYIVRIERESEHSATPEQTA